jgi:phosphoribosylformylglycinamidine cyclo-ligase
MRRGFVKGCAHLTGGGFQENIDRILPPQVDAVIDTRQWEPDAIFKYLQSTGNVENDEMYRTFNMGIGMVLVVDVNSVNEVLSSESLKAFEPTVIGEIRQGTGVVAMEFGA